MTTKKTMSAAVREVVEGIIDAGVYEDRLEYDVESLEASYPHLSHAEAVELYDVLRNDPDVEARGVANLSYDEGE